MMSVEPQVKNDTYRFAFEKEVCVRESLSALRQRAARRFRKIGFPETKNDLWKYMDLRPILDEHFTDAPCGQTTLSPGEFQDFVSGGQEGNHLVFINGFYNPSLSQSVSPLGGAVIQNMAEAIRRQEPLIDKYLGADVDRNTDPFYLVNTFQFHDGVYIHVPDSQTVAAPLHIWFLTSQLDGPSVFYPRNLIHLGRNAKLSLVFHSIGTKGSKTFMNEATDVVLSQNAHLRTVRIQQGAPETLTLSGTRAHLEPASSLDATHASWGGAFTRNDIRTDLAGKGAFVSLKGLSILSGASQVFNQTTVSHIAGRTVSRQLYKSILSDSSRAEYTGLVHVHRGAAGSDSNQLSRHLVLSPEARTHSRPQLKIDTDDVRCTHGATTGQLQDNELFYLKTRGLSDRQAREVLTFGFAEEVIEDIDPAVLRQLLERHIQDELKGS